METSGVAPAEVICPTFNPGIVPCKDWRILVFGAFSKSFIFALTTAPVKSDFFIDPYPTTTTSSNISLSGVIKTFNIVFPSTANVCDL